MGIDVETGNTNHSIVLRNISSLLTVTCQNLLLQQYIIEMPVNSPAHIVTSPTQLHCLYIYAGRWHE